MHFLERLLLALGLVAALVLLRLLGNRHLRSLVSPPIRLPLVAIAVWLISSSVPVTLLPPALQPWWSIMAELAIWIAGGTTVAIFPTETADTIRYVLDHSGASLLFVGKLDTWAQQTGGVPQGLPLRLRCQLP